MTTQDNEQISSEQTGIVTPPPFCPNETEAGPQEQAASPTLAERIAQLALDEDDSRRLAALTAGLDADSLSSELLTTLAQGVTHDTDVQNADATGYLRGRNEKIEAVLQPEPEQDEEATVAVPAFPRYNRRSIWD